jgi:hypothetical protein
MFNKKIKKSHDPIFIYMNGETVGEVIRIIAKEVQGQTHFDMWLKFNFGNGIEPLLEETLRKTGLHIGVPVYNVRNTENAVENVKKIEELSSQQDENN